VVPRQVVLLSGRVASGKSTLCDHLRQFENVSFLKTKKLIADAALKKLGHAMQAERRAMQNFGDRLDRETKGQWVRDELRRWLGKLGASEPSAVVVVDSIRILEQIKAIRESYGYAVLHIHLRASDSALARRYASKSSGLKELRSHTELTRNYTEAKVEELERAADVVIDTELCKPEDVLVRAATHMGLYTREYGRTVDVLVGGQYGSEGKGHIASYLAREYGVLVRVGGPNAGHKVFMRPTPYIHHQLPSGTLRNTTARLVIAPGAVLNVELLLREMSECRVDVDRLFIDPQAMVITGRDIAREKGLVERIGSTGQGVGMATARRIMDRGNKTKLVGDVKELKRYVRETWEVLEQAYNDGSRILVEGTQGTGLSLYHGAYPFVTSRDTTVSGCLSEAGISPSRVRKVTIVCRTYPIRVQDPSDGTSGKMSQEIDWDIVSERSGIPVSRLKKTERTSTTDRRRRVSEFDWALLRKSAALNGPTDIALTFADYLDSKNADARRYEQLRPETIRFIEEVERFASAPVSLISTRFDFRSIIDRRSRRLQ
jgi:adenylosuccinate synthase